jgi:hypothetical protein
MPKKGLRRFQLFLLVVVVGLIVWRMTSSPAGEGFITLTDPGERSLASGQFEVRQSVMVHVAGEVSFEDDAPGAPLAVLAWILDRNSGEPVWTTEAARVTREGVRALVDDSVRLDPGLYAVYLSTYGPDNASHRGGAAFGLKPHWTNYDAYWHLDLRAPEDAVRVLDRPKETPSAGTSLARFSLQDRGKEQRIMLLADGVSSFRLSGGVTRCPNRCDEASIRRIPSGVVVWRLDQVDVQPAGGSEINQWVDTEIPLTDGVYEFVFEPGGHEGGWSENPPWRPDDFVLTVSPGAQGRVSLVDPWRGGQPLVDQTRQGDDVLVETRITTADSLDVIVFAMGELRSDANRYDWGWIERADTGERIWEMTWENSDPAGGDSDNRQAMAILTLPPGSYVAGYQSDGSHSFADFNRSRPRNPERWGLAVFALDPDRLETDRVQVERIERPTSVVAVGSALTDVAEHRFLARLTGLGDNQDVSSSFELTDTTRVIIQALGEISESSAYDYGWLENEQTGVRVWEMTRQNTTAGGDSDSFRAARTEMMLIPGRYRAHFHTDGSVSYEDYGSDVPYNPEDWGIAIFRAE